MRHPLGDLVPTTLAAAAMTNDGEGFRVEVEMNDALWESPAWETLVLPYSDPMARGEPAPWSAVSRLQFALRQANSQLVKRGVKPVPDPTTVEEAS